MTLDVITTLDDLIPLAQRWDELAREDPRDGFFRTFDWYRAWLQHIRPDAAPFVIIARDSSSRVIGLAPLCRLTYKDLGLRLGAVAWAGREVVSGDFLDVIADATVRREVATELWTYLLDSEQEWGLLVLGELLDGSESLSVVERLATERGLMLRRQEERICPYIDLPRTFEEYLGSLGSSTRYHIRRRLRDVEKRGARVCTYRSAAEIVERLDTLVRLHMARWRMEGQPGTFGRQGFVSFLKDALTGPGLDASARLYELTHGQEVVASLLAFEFGESALYYQAGWDPASPLAALSPGVALMAHSIRDAVEHGLRYYEFLRGDEAYKARWTRQYRTTVTVLAGRGAAARAYLRLANLKDTVKHYARPSRTPAIAGVEAHEDVPTQQGKPS